MLYSILEQYFNDPSVANLFRYISFRSVVAFFTSLFLSFMLGPKIIAFLKSRQIDGQPIRKDGPESHLIHKKGTPTMGGIIILIPVLITTFLWTDLSNQYVWIILFITVSFASVGIIDDLMKLTKNSSDGISAKKKFLLQFLFAFIAIFLIQKIQGHEVENKIYLPIFKDIILDIGLFYFIFGMIVIVGSSNAVNLTDGLDGLAIVPIIIALFAFGLICYVVGNIVYSSYLHLPYINGSGEISIIIGAVIGASLGFLWYNAPPARIFMGDTGSLSLGALLGTASIISKNEVVLVIIGGIFVIEAISVIVQVYSFKLTGKRVFRMAPIHHHYEKKGWSESTIVIRFWIIAIILCVIGLLTLKLR